MTKSLPARPSLENLKKQAKTLLRSHKSGDPSVFAILRRLHRFTDLSDQGILDSKLSLAEAQYALAMEHGFPSWSALKDAVKGKEDEMRFLHLQCGDYSAESLRRSGVPGKVAVWYDAFVMGPVPANVSEDDFIRLRANTFADHFQSLEQGYRAFADMHRQLDDYPAFLEVVLWFDACMFDQTILIHHLDHYSRRDMGKTKLSLICIGEFPGFRKFSGLGELNPAQMASLMDVRHDVTRAELHTAVEAWDAFRSSDPRQIEKLLTRDTSALPYLGPALRRHLQQFPSVRNGLSRTEQECLDVIAQGHTAFMDVFVRVSDMEAPPFLGDTMLVGQLENLAAGPHPLVVIEGVERTVRIERDPSLKNLNITLTDTGSDVLAGKADLVRLNGIDRWLGGVHLHGQEAGWRWDEDRGVLVRML